MTIKRADVRSRIFKLRIWLVAVVMLVSMFALVGCITMTAPVRAEVPAISRVNTVARYVSGTEVVVQVSWSDESRCASCHKEEVASTQDERLAAKHPDSNCLDCHSNTASLKEIHADLVQALRANPPRSLSKTAISESTCTACHDPTEIKNKTDGAIKDKEGSLFNPHDVPASESHSEITCTKCHEAHSADSATKASADTCSSCHHENIYSNCATCHE